MRYSYQSMEGILTVKFDSIKASWAQVIAYEYFLKKTLLESCQNYR